MTGSPDAAGTVTKALQLAYAYLNRRDRTEAELRAYLLKRDLAEADVEAAVTELLEFGYIDDASYARMFAQDKRTLEEWGSDRIRRSLRERGVDRDLIDAALTEVDPENDERSRALALLRRRFPEPPADRRERDRALGVMVRKGFDSDLALDALSVYSRGGELD